MAYSFVHDHAATLSVPGCIKGTPSSASGPRPMKKMRWRASATLHQRLDCGHRPRVKSSVSLVQASHCVKSINIRPALRPIGLYTFSHSWLSRMPGTAAATRGSAREGRCLFDSALAEQMNGRPDQTFKRRCRRQDVIGKPGPKGKGHGTARSRNDY